MVFKLDIETILEYQTKTYAKLRKLNFKTFNMIPAVFYSGSATDIIEAGVGSQYSTV